MAVSEKSISDKIETRSILEELRYENEYNFITSHKKDLEKLLILAEELKKNFDYISNKIIVVKFIQIILVISFFIYLFGGYVFTKEIVYRERLAFRTESIDTQRDLLRNMSFKRDLLTQDLNYSHNDDVKASIQQRIGDIEQSIKSTENNLNTQINSPIPELSFSDFISMYEKTIPALLIVFVGLFISLYFNSRYKQKIFPDKIALAEVLQLLRETSDIVANKEDWTTLSRAEFRIRLSRFSLEEKPKSVFDIFS